MEESQRESSGPNARKLLGRVSCKSGGRHQDGWWKERATAHGVIEVDNLLRRHPQGPEKGKGKSNFSAKANRHRFDVSYLASNELVTITDTKGLRSAGNNFQELFCKKMRQEKYLGLSIDLDLDIYYTRGLCFAKGL